MDEKMTVEAVDEYNQDMQFMVSDDWQDWMNAMDAMAKEVEA